MWHLSVSDQFFVNLLNGGSINAILGGSSPVQAQTVTVTPDTKDPMLNEPKNTPVSDPVDYAFALAPKTYNADSLMREVKQADNPAPQKTPAGVVAGVQITPVANQGQAQVQVQAGVKDNLVTAEVKQQAQAAPKPLEAQGANIVRIMIPSVKIDSPVIQGGDGDAALDQGMWLYPTSYAKGEKVLLCHRRFFGPSDPRSCWYMDRVKTGDIITLQGKAGNTFRYEVITQGVRDGDDLAIFRAGDDDIVKIITCTPLGSSSHRLITIARRIP